MAVCGLVIGCGPRYTALAPGNPMPAIQVAGWTQLEGNLDELTKDKVVVLIAFATW